MVNFEKTHRLTLWLVGMLLAVAVLTLALWIIGSGTDPNETKTQAITEIKIENPTKPKKKEFSLLHPGSDSWEPMIAALGHYKNNPDDPIYEAVLFNGAEKFQYPPSGLLVFDLPERILGWSYSKTTRFLDGLSLVCFLLMGLITAKILMLVLEESRFKKYKCTTLYEKSVRYTTIVLLTLVFYPIRRSYGLGQIQTILTFLGVLSILSWQYKRKGLTGILIGLTCLVKPQLLLLFLWGAIRQQWKMVLAGSAVMISFLLLSIALYGFGNHLDYLSVLSYISHHGEAFYSNQSMNGIMSRALFNGSNLTFSNHNFPPYLMSVYVVTLISTLVFVLCGLLWNYKNRYPTIIELSIMILCLTMASPVAWIHHYGIVLTIFVICTPYVLYYHANWKYIVFISIGFLLTAINIQVVNQLAHTKLNVLQSYFFFGSSIILIFLFRISYLHSFASKLKALKFRSIE